MALEYSDPQFDPHAAFQKWKTHPFLKQILDGGKLVRYGAKSLPYGGWYAMPRNYLDGGLITHSNRLTCHAPLTKKVTWPQNRQDCFFADLINNGELYTAFLNVHHTRSGITLRADLL